MMIRLASRDTLETVRRLIRLARPFRGQFLVIALLALVDTGADLARPLIYRTAINDVAGLFVDRVSETATVVQDVTVLDEGRVIEQGTPQGLLAAGGWFARPARQSMEDAPEVMNG